MSDLRTEKLPIDVPGAGEPMPAYVAAPASGGPFPAVLVLEEIFGTSGRLGDMHVSGMTDLQIVFEALNDSGISQEEILARAEVLVARLTEEARRVTGNGVKFFELLPGVRETRTYAVMEEVKSSARLPLGI